ncbi:MAG TPA: DUF1614 domain-containing protein [Chloroflexota bacterium]|nr:DUF1614 domain-containing protein [Chloroflexota bacterium]
MNWRWIVAAALLLPFLIAFLFLQVITISFAKLGLSPSGALLVYLGSLLGGWFNIPVWRRPVARNVGTSVWPWAMASRRAWGGAPIPYRLFFYQPPVVQEQVIAINLGGAVIPLIMCAYLLPRVPLGSALLATAGVAALCYALARPAWPVGIVVPAFVPPVAAAVLAMIAAPSVAPPVAYISGTLGTLIGADLLHLRDLERFDVRLLSIGGAGVHDGIFYAGLIAALLS